jgi:aerobic carbon-monoxide dehydrogenase large subunit
MSSNEGIRDGAEPFTGRSIERTEDDKLLRGQGRYIDDLRIEGLLHVAFVRSPQAHGRIAGIDKSAALAMPGVLAVLTMEDFGAAYENKRLPQTAPIPALTAAISTPYPLARSEVCFVGEPVAMVIAQDRYLAEDAAAMVVLDIEPLDAVVKLREAAGSAHRVRQGQPDNLAGKLQVGYGDVDATLTGCAHRIKTSVSMHRGGGHSMECRGVVARFESDTDALTLWTSTQLPHTIRKNLAIYLGWDEHRVRVIAPDVGGGFGPKGIFYPEEAALALASINLRKPLKWVEDRREHFLSCVQQRDQVWSVEIGADAQGRVKAVRARGQHDCGAYLLYGLLLPVTTVVQFPGPYRWEAVDVQLDCLFTNLTPTAPVRGAGRPYACFVIEQIMDCVARVTGIDRAEIRRRNLIQAEQFPHATGLRNLAGVPIVYDSGDYHAALEQALAMIDWNGFEARRAAARAQQRHLGIGLASYVEDSGIPPYEGATVRVLPTGRIVIHTGAASQGQGHATILAQVCADQLGVPIEAIEVCAGDTGTFARGIGTLGSRIAVTAGNSVYLAARAVRAKALRFAAEVYQVSPEELNLQGGLIVRRDSSGAALSPPLTIGMIAMQLNGSPGVPVRPAFDPGLEATEYFQATRSVYSSGTCACEVEVDIHTGDVRISRFVFVHDCGNILNPMIVDGQVIGGVVHAIGNALFERMDFDDEGQPLSTNYGEYLLPLATEMPRIEVAHCVTPSPLNPLGLKGAGESGSIPTTPCVVAAIEDALREFDVRLSAHPVSPVQLLEAIERGRNAE